MSAMRIFYHYTRDFSNTLFWRLPTPALKHSLVLGMCFRCFIFWKKAQKYYNCNMDTENEKKFALIDAQNLYFGTTKCDSCAKALGIELK